MAKCICCHKESNLISSALDVCVDCIRFHFEEVKSHIEELHRRSRERFGLPPEPPHTKEGLKCNICVNQCEAGIGERGYCGVRLNRKGEFLGGGKEEGNFSWYYDLLPTNCVAEWVCGSSGEYGYKNLAVFFQACSFNCLFCQNWHYREESTKKGRLPLEEIIDGVDAKTACICYFGGDPTPQLLYALQASQKAIEKKETLRICWETNGSMNPELLEKMAKVSLKSGGCLKFDLKTYKEELNIALCGVSNRQTLSNFKLMAKYIAQRPEPPLLVASTLLIPGYVDEKEVRAIAEFIASVEANIPYSLLGFYPHFYMRDLPTTSRKHAQLSESAAKEAGLKRVRIGNVHLLGDAY